MNYWKMHLGHYLIGLKIVDNLIIVLAIIPYQKLFNPNIISRLD
ncbi:hypothetical protein [Thermodesulfatator autotrophicus]|nr:hypothetical protein [Thermodesulfatator autotrophicus]